MQTFLPLPDFHDTALALDNKRLGKQRVEAYQIMKVLRGETKGWRNHPAVLMWRDYEPALYEYGRIVCVEWRARGFVDNLYDKFPKERLILPKWLGDMRLHISHQSNLVRKLPEYYKEKFPDVPDNLPYFWVSNEKDYTHG